MNLQISQDGLNKLVQREEIRTTAYRDTRGIWTIGVGHTSAAGNPDVHEGLTISTIDAYKIFQKDLESFEQCVNSMVKVKVNQDQFDSMVSLAYNIGNHAFANSSLIRDLNDGASLDQLDKDILKWNQPNEIIGRRKSERTQFDSRD